MKGVLPLLGLVCLALACTVTAKPGEHGKIVACYWGAWSFYRLDNFILYNS